MKKKCPLHEIEISSNREIVVCDKKKHEWEQDPKGYFLVKIDRKKGQVCCGFVEAKTHVMKVEFRGRDTEKIIKEIAARNLCSLGNMGYIASELMAAKHCLDQDKEYIQR